MTSLIELLDAIDDVQRDLERLITQIDYQSVEHLYQVSNYAARLETLAMEALARAQLGGWHAEARAHILHLAGFAADTVARADTLRAEVITSQAIEAAKHATLH